jgi:hypothetical protein
VLYVGQSDYECVIDIVGVIYRELKDTLNPATPVFTKQLAPGLGLAEEPSEGGSFGMHRCGLLADALIRASEHGATSLDDRLGVVAECFEEAGLSLDRPFLNPGSNVQYAFGARAE